MRFNRSLWATDIGQSLTDATLALRHNVVMNIITRWGILWSVSWLLVSCTASTGERAISASVVEAMQVPDNAGFARADAPMTLRFPADHGAHPEYRTEWWYYTGNLVSEEGTPFGFQLTFFRNALAPALPERTSTLATNQVYMAHFAVTDGKARRHSSFDRYSRGAGGLAGAEATPQVRVWLEDWQVVEFQPGHYRLMASASSETGAVAIDLQLRESRPPVLHGDAGLHQKGAEAGNASYYYSLVGLETSGTLTSGGQSYSVQGRSWMDHEFGTSALSADAIGWDWFSIQFDNDAILMFYKIRLADGGVHPHIQGTWLGPDGQRTIDENDFLLEATGSWSSPRTGITYPSGWTLSIPELELALTIEPLLADQEMQVSFVYWEGAIEVAGTLAGEQIRGKGYAELTGYGEQNSAAYQR